MKSSASVASQSSGTQAPAALVERLFLDAPMAFQVYDAPGKCVFSNSAFHRMFAVDSSREYNIFADVAPARRSLREAVQRAFAGETVRLAVESRDTLWPTTTLTGEGLGSGIEATVFPVADRDNVVRHVAICYQHAPLERWRRSEQLRIDEERQKSNERLRRAFEAARMLAWETDVLTRDLHVSENAADLLGLPEGAALERLDDALAVVHPEDRASLEEALKLAVKEGSAQARRFRIIRPVNGEIRWLEWRSVTSGPTGAVVRGVVMDVTDSVEAEDARFMSEARYRTQFEAAPEAIVTLNVDNGCFMEVNEKAEKLFGYSRGQLMKKGPIELSPPVQPDGRPSAEAAVAYLAEAMKGERPAFEWVHRDATGRDFHCEIRLVRLPDPGKRNLCRGSIIDITDRKLAEVARLRLEETLRKTEDQLRQAQKMEAIGRLAGGVAHDFNNLLSVVLSYSTFALSSLDPEDSVAADVREIQSAGKRAADLTRQLLAFSRQQMLAPAVVDLNEVVGQMDSMLRRLIGEDVDLRTVTPPSLGKVKVDRGQIQQVIMNLAINARDAMPSGGTLTIATTDVFLDEAYAGSHVGVKVGPHVLLSVADSGVGMSAEVQARIFEPFFTTKERGKGTGLGLSMVLGIVEQSGGSIAVESEPARGATFKIYFPCTDEDPDSMQLTVLPRTLRGHETVLLVEDEEQLRKLGREILAKSGYNVIVADTPMHALEICEKYGETIHLLLTDVVMPVMNGRELAERAAKLRPAMKVLYVSGYTDNTIVHHGVLEEGVAFLQKPLTPDALRRKLRDVLDNERRSDAPRGKSVAPGLAPTTRNPEK